jgi:hypothetical protein
MPTYAVVNGAGAIINRIVLDNEAGWSVPAGFTVHLETDQTFEIGGTMIAGVYTPPDPPPAPDFEVLPTIESWGLVRFTVSGGRITATSDALNVAGVTRVGTGKYRILLDQEPEETLMAFPVAIDPSNDRRALTAARGADYLEIRIVNSATPPVLVDAAEVYVELKRVAS